ncbi:hypothetical protein VUR80DRAFT_1823 [Thermomyces stellatus]
MNSSAISRGDPKPRSFPRAVSLTCWRQSSPNKHWTCPRLESHRLTSGALPYRRTNSLATRNIIPLPSINIHVASATSLSVLPWNMPRFINSPVASPPTCMWPVRGIIVKDNITLAFLSDALLIPLAALTRPCCLQSFSPTAGNRY